MKIYRNPKRYHLQYDDHSFSTGSKIDLRTLEKMEDITPIQLNVTGWLIAENAIAYIVAGTMECHPEEVYFDELWTILKVKGLVKVKCDE